MIEPLENERIDLQRILDTEEYWFDLKHKGWISIATYDLNVQKCHQARQRHAHVTARLFAMMYAESVGEDPLIWKLSRP